MQRVLERVSQLSAILGLKTDPSKTQVYRWASSSSESEDIRTGHTHQGGLLNELCAAETLSFSTDVSDTRWQRKRRKLRKSRNPGQGR